LLDTHVLLWWLQADPRLSEAATKAIAESTTDAFVSVVSIWEIAIKAGLGRLEMPDDLEAFFDRHLSINGFAVLPIQLRHAAAVRNLPNHHRDPFDRLLVAQVQAEDLRLISSDEQLDAYEIDVLW